MPPFKQGLGSHTPWAVVNRYIDKIIERLLLYAGTLPQWHHEPPNNSPIDAGKGWVDTPADSLTQCLADEVTASIRRERHAQNNNKTAELYKAMLMNPCPTAWCIRCITRSTLQLRVDDWTLLYNAIKAIKVEFVLELKVVMREKPSITCAYGRVDRVQGTSVTYSMQAPLFCRTQTSNSKHHTNIHKNLQKTWRSRLVGQ